MTVAATIQAPIGRTSPEEEFSVIKTLVSIEVDLASSLAIRFACQLGGTMNMEIQPVYIKESPTRASSWGAGWAGRTWEKEMVQQGVEEIAELVEAEKDFCPVLKEPRVIYGDREGESLKIATSEDFDMFIEGAHFTWTLGDLYKRIHSKLYQRIPYPVILVRALRKVNHVQLLCFDAQGAETLTRTFQKIWHDCPIPLVLNYPAAGMAPSKTDELRVAVDRARAILTEAGCAVTVQNSLSPDPGTGSAEALKDCGLVAVALERAVRKDCPEIQWLSEVKTSALLAFR